MRNIYTIMLIGTLLLFAGCIEDDLINVPDEHEVPGIQVIENGPEYVEGQYIVVVKKSCVPEEIIKEYGIEEFYIYRKVLNGFILYNATEELVNALMKNPDIEYLEQDMIVRANVQTIPNGISRIEADATSVSGNVDVDIAIIDTGIDTDHPDLNVHTSGIHYWREYVRNRWRPFSDNDFDDDNGHGTHCAGTAAAIDNNIGVVGVAPGARVWGVKVLDEDGSGFISDIVRGLDWVSERSSSIEIASMSLGGRGYSASLRTAVQDCVSEGIVVVVAAGNDSRDIYGRDGNFGTNDDDTPASFPEAMTISALCDTDGQPGGLGNSNYYGDDDSFAEFSNYSQSVVSNNPVTSSGAAIDLILPGVNVYSTSPGGNYQYMSGTSMATPHAAGLVAMYIAENGRATNATGVYSIRQALINGGEGMYTSDNGLESDSDPEDPDNNHENLGWAGSGSSNSSDPVADAGNAITANDDDDSGSESVLLDGSDSYDDDGSIVSYEWKEGSTVIGTSSTINISFNVGIHNIILTVTDDDGNTDEDEVVVTIIENQDPVADAGNIINVTDEDDNGSETVQLDGSDSYDEDGTIVSYSWTLNGNTIGTTASLNYSFNVGTHTVVLTVTDNGGATSSDQLTVIVSEATTDPTIASITPNSGRERTTVNIVIRGSGFQDRASIKFRGGRGRAPIARSVTVVSSTEIRATVRIRNSWLRNPTRWNVIVKNRDRSRATLNNGFTVNPR